MKKLILFVALFVSSPAHSTEEEFNLCLAGAFNHLRAAIYKDMGASAMDAYEGMLKELIASMPKGNGTKPDWTQYDEVMRNAIKTVYADPMYTVEFARAKQEEMIPVCQAKLGAVKP